MKGWKNLAFLAVAMVAVFVAVGLVGCGDGNGGNDPGNGGNNPVKIGDFGGIPVYRNIDISKTDGETALENINTAISFGTDDMATLVEKVKSIQIVSGNVLVWDGTILKVGLNATSSEINGYMFDIIDGLIEP